MLLHSFSSLFELFCTFTLAYILIDEITEKSFLSLVTERMLHAYRPIEEIFQNIREVISGHRTSLDNLAVSNVKNQTYQDDLPGIENSLKGTKTRVEQSYIEIRHEIRTNYATKIFSYLNCYLFLYCLLMIYYGGLYQVNIEQEVASHYYNKLDKSLACFVVVSALLLVIGWILDQQVSAKMMDDIQRHINGYFIATVLFFGLAFICMLCFYLGWWSLIIYGTIWHDLLVIACIALPISNFVVYILKARSRVKRTRTHLIEKAEQFKKDYIKELELVNQFITLCSYRGVPSLVST